MGNLILGEKEDLFLSPQRDEIDGRNYKTNRILHSLSSDVRGLRVIELGAKTGNT